MAGWAQAHARALPLLSLRAALASHGGRCRRTAEAAGGPHRRHHRCAPRPRRRPPRAAFLFFRRFRAAFRPDNAASSRAAAGATHGIGYAVARQLAAQGATVVLVARNKTRALECQAAIVAEGGAAEESATKVELVLADLSAQADVRAAAREIAARFPAVHILVRGACVAGRSEAKEGAGAAAVQGLTTESDLVASCASLAAARRAARATRPCAPCRVRVCRAPRAAAHAARAPRRPRTDAQHALTHFPPLPPSLSAFRLLCSSSSSSSSRARPQVNCAGVLNVRRVLTVDGVEETLAVNHLAPWLLTTSLLPVLKATAAAASAANAPGVRVVNVGSDAQKWVKTFNFDDPNLEKARTHALRCRTRAFALPVALRAAGGSFRARVPCFVAHFFLPLRAVVLHGERVRAEQAGQHAVHQPAGGRAAQPGRGAHTRRGTRLMRQGLCLCSCTARAARARLPARCTHAASRRRAAAAAPRRVTAHTLTRTHSPVRPAPLISFLRTTSRSTAATPARWQPTSPPTTAGGRRR
jgi:NAD(P)-dependent dehydrogenase (short-subunit alcohol dehydrogenase family)